MTPEEQLESKQLLEELFAVAHPHLQRLANSFALQDMTADICFTICETDGEIEIKAFNRAVLSEKFREAEHPSCQQAGQTLAQPLPLGLWHVVLVRGEYWTTGKLAIIDRSKVGQA